MGYYLEIKDNSDLGNLSHWDIGQTPLFPPLLFFFFNDETFGDIYFLSHLASHGLLQVHYHECEWLSLTFSQENRAPLGG